MSAFVGADNERCTRVAAEGRASGCRYVSPGTVPTTTTPPPAAEACSCAGI